MTSFIEHCGSLHTFDKNYNIKELWFIAKNYNVPDIQHKSKLWYNQEYMGCSYDESIMEEVKTLKVNLFAYKTKPVVN